ncbi:secreted protein containing Sulphatase-modifying factor domain protein [Candidatus Magnetomorum sp. HK-1]|nr:secreted protein containing Sulphatase-modifying factor domain protein [Candidatus Magnetomorum sp. HK-1]
MKNVIIICSLLFFAQIAIAQEKFFPADTNQDWKISGQEFDAYNKAWQNKENWSVEPNPIPMDYVTRAGYLFSFGENYYFDETQSGSLQWKVGKFKPITNSIGMTFVYIPPGTFMMGSPENELGRDIRGFGEDLHEVTLTKGYFMQTTEITQGQWKAVMGNNPSLFNNCGDDCPAENFHWNDVQDFISTLNQKEKTTKYRLPTEAEWEYAARAGATTAFPNGDISDTDCNDPKLDEIGWYCGNSNDKTHPVGQKKANNFNLFDMHGNVMEWCQDWFQKGYPYDSAINPEGPSSGSYRVIRDCSFSDEANKCRSATRYRNSPDYLRRSYLGARIAFTVDFNK